MGTVSQWQTNAGSPASRPSTLFFGLSRGGKARSSATIAVFLFSVSAGCDSRVRGIRLALLMAGSAFFLVLILSSYLAAGPMTTDPNGFYGFEWGLLLADVQDLIQVESREHVQAYELKEGAPKLGEATVDSLRFVTFDGQFARATIHYHGNQTHTQILAYLQSLYGLVDRTPGSMMRGLNQQFTWRGPQTEVNLTYDGGKERGHIFIESRTLAPRFNDVLPEHAF